MRKVVGLLIPDSPHWVTGTMASNFIKANQSWLDALVVSGDCLNRMRNRQQLMESAHFVHWLTEFQAIQWSKLQRSQAVIHSVHHLEPRWDLPKLYDCDAIHTVSQQWHQRLVDRGISSERIITSPNGYDPGVFYPLVNAERLAHRRSLGFEDSSIVVGMAGKVSSNTSARKAPEVFLAAVKELAKRKPETGVLFIGPGWEPLASELRREGVKAVAAGHVPTAQDVRRCLGALDVYWVTSRIEGGPVPALEALACGTPVVGTRVGILPEIICDGENGYLVDFDCPAQIADATERCHAVSPETHRLAAVASASAWTWNKVAMTSRRLYETALRAAAARTGSPKLREAVNIASDATDTLPVLLDKTVFSRSTRDSIAVFDERSWVNILLSVQERRAAIRTALQSLIRRPSYLDAWGAVFDSIGGHEIQNSLANSKKAVRRVLRFAKR